MQAVRACQGYDTEKSPHKQTESGTRDVWKEFLTPIPHCALCFMKTSGWFGAEILLPIT